MPLFIECVENDITLGEICNALRGVLALVLCEAPCRMLRKERGANLLRKLIHHPCHVTRVL